MTSSCTFCHPFLQVSCKMDKDKARFAHRQSRSKERRRRESTSTTRATKRDMQRVDRSPLSSRISQFARQLEHRHSASSTARDKNPRGVTTEPAMQSVASNPDVARPSAPPQSRECREQPTSTTALPCVVVTARQASKRRSHTVCAKSTIHRCVNLVYPLQCLNVPLGVQLSCAKKRLVGMSSRDRWTCVNSVRTLVSKMRSEMSTTIPLMESRHFARSRSTSSHQNLEPASDVEEHLQAGADVQTSLISDLSFITSESVTTEAEPPNLSEEVEANLTDAGATIVKERVIPLDVLRERYLVKQATQTRVAQLASCTPTEDQPVKYSGGGDALEQQPAAATAVSAWLATATSTSNQPAQPCATIEQHIPEPNLVASQKATSPAARTEARQGHGEKRGSQPRHMSRSTTSRTPMTERYGYRRREPQWDNRSRSPRRFERHITPRPSPGRRLSVERGRRDLRRSSGYDRGRESTSDAETKRLFEAFLSFMSRPRD